MPSPNPLAGLNVVIRRHLSVIIIALQRRGMLTAVVTIRHKVQAAIFVLGSGTITGGSFFFEVINGEGKAWQD